MEQVVSVIIPVYNRVTFLPTCMEALRAQTYQNLQILLIDDGSTDGTLELCNQYAAEDSRVTVIPGTHSGVSAARNLGLDAATGEYVFFIDSDDSMHPRLIETEVRHLNETKAAIAGSRLLYLNGENWSQIPQFIAQSPDSQARHRSHSDVLEDFFRGYSPIRIVGGVMLRRDLIGQTRFNTELFIGEDYYFVYQNLIKGADAVYLSERWYYYLDHPANSNQNPRFESFWNRFYRRKLVWQSEEALGRQAYADAQKRNAFSIYLNFTVQNWLSKADRKKMRAAVKAHKKELFPAFRTIGKVRYYLAVYLPWSQRLLNKLGRFIKKH